jgi:hypothetical protein
MSNRWSRFQNLERARERTGEEAGRVELRDEGRFESVNGPVGAPSAHEVPEEHLERFRRQGQTPLVLDAEQGQRFPRCIRCQTSNSRFTQTCVTCGADLQSAEQRAEDEARWRAEDEANERMKTAMDVAVARREELGRSEEEQTAAHAKWFEPSLAMALLRRVRPPGARGAVLVGVVAGVWLLCTRAPSESVRMLGVYLGVFVAASLVPSGFWTGARRD